MRANLATWILFAAVFCSAQDKLATAHRAVDRITGRITNGPTRTVPGTLHRVARTQADLGAVDPTTKLEYIMMLIKPSTAQQADLDQLLADQQNPGSPHFHKWLTPEQYGARFGLTTSDHSKIVAWLATEGFTVNDSGRGRNWVAFTGTAAQVSKTLHTTIRRFQVDGRIRFANVDDPAVPEALGDVVGGFLGLNNIPSKSNARKGPPLPSNPDYSATSNTFHLMAPDDFSTIYDVAPLAKAGMDGTGQTIAVVGESDVSISDLRAFKTQFKLPTNDPKMILYGGSDPGFNGAELEGDLDLEWTGAMAPKATIYYVYGADAFSAAITAISSNLASVLSISYGSCEVDDAAAAFRSIFQQGNAQGMTILASSGDAGPAGCDAQISEPLATLGRTVDFPAVLPEVTGVGGTMFSEGTGTYWSSSNSSTLGSALSYIPETAWNETSPVNSLFAGGGGVSALYPRPAWQNAPGMPNDNFRHVPDIALSAAFHDGYLIYSQGSLTYVAGTSCGTPSMAGVVALLNQYQVSKSFQKTPGLGNINPQLYRTAQSAPTAFHDITTGNTNVPCAQGSPDCTTGTIGYTAGPGYDMTTGLGSIDANNLVTQWNVQVNSVKVTLTASGTKGTLNDAVTLTATVVPTATAASGTPTGNVDFSTGTGDIQLGSVPLAVVSGQATAVLTLPLWQFDVVGTPTITANYSGDSVFSGGGATTRIQVTVPASGSGIVLTGPTNVWPTPPPTNGLSWETTLNLREAAGVPALITGMTIDGVPQQLSQYFPSPNIPASSTVSTTFVQRNLMTPVRRVYGFSGLDATGQNWYRSWYVDYSGTVAYLGFSLTASPLVVNQNPAADPSCQWAVQVNADDLSGYAGTISGIYIDSVSMTSQASKIFGTTRLEAWAGIQGTICFGPGIVAPTQALIEVDLDIGYVQQVTVALVGPATNPTTIAASQASVALQAGGVTPSVQGKLTLSLNDKTQQPVQQPWTASVFPANRTTSWLTVSQLSGVGPAQLTLTATAAGFEPGAYQATIVFQSVSASPQTLSVPVTFVIGANGSDPSIAAVLSAASFQPSGSPGELMTVFGSFNTPPAGVTGSPLPYTLGNVTATVNGIAAPLLYVSANQINLQIPYQVSAGPAVLGVNHLGQAAGFSFLVQPASPTIFTDLQGFANPTSTVVQGGTIAFYVTGMGDVSQGLLSGWSPATGTPLASLPKPFLPVSVTVGGIPAFTQFIGVTPGLVGEVQLNVRLPASVPPGVQPVVVTANGVASPPVNVTVTAAPGVEP